VYARYVQLMSERAAAHKQSKPTIDVRPLTASAAHESRLTVRRGSLRSASIAAGLTVDDEPPKSKPRPSPKATPTPKASSTPKAARKTPKAAAAVPATPKEIERTKVPDREFPCAKHKLDSALRLVQVSGFLSSVMASTEREDESRERRPPIGALVLGSGLTPFSPIGAAPRPKLTVSEVRELIEKETQRKERLRINTKLEALIAAIPDRTQRLLVSTPLCRSVDTVCLFGCCCCFAGELCTPRPRSEVTDPDLNFEFHAEVDRQRTERKEQRLHQQQKERERVEREEKERAFRYRWRPSEKRTDRKQPDAPKSAAEDTKVEDSGSTSPVRSHSRR
jgi:hypothetical protein